MANPNSPTQAIVHLAFLALFPGFFFYHTALGRGVIGPILGGYFSPVALAALPVLLFIYVQKIKQERSFFTRTDRVFFAFVLFFFFIVLINFSVGADREVVTGHLVSIIHFVVVFIIFRMAEFKENRFRTTAILCLLAMSAIVYFMSVDGVFYLRRQGESPDSESVAAYQGFARSYLVTFIAVIPYIKSGLPRLLLYCLAMPALFLNGSRSELLALAGLIGVIEVFHAKHKVAVISFVLGIASLFILYSDSIIELFPGNRSTQVFDMDRSSSWESRDLLFSQALRTIAAHPILGDYGSYASFFGSAGSNAHNIFSAWVDLGFPGFLFLVSMLLVPAYFLIVSYFFGDNAKPVEELLLAFSLMFVTLLLLATAKSFTYVLIAAALARYASYRRVNDYCDSSTAYIRRSPSERLYFYREAR